MGLLWRLCINLSLNGKVIIMFYNNNWSSVKLQHLAMAIHYSHDCQMSLIDGMNHLQDIIEAIISLNI